MTFIETFETTLGDNLLKFDENDLSQDPVVLLKRATDAFMRGGWYAVCVLVGSQDDEKRIARADEVRTEIIDHEHGRRSEGRPSGFSLDDMLSRGLTGHDVSQQERLFLDNLLCAGARYVVTAIRGDALPLVRERYESVKEEVARAIGYDRAPDDWRPGMDGDDADEYNG